MKKSNPDMRQVAKALSMIAEFFEGNLEEMIKFLEEAKRNLDNVDWKAPKKRVKK